MSLNQDSPRESKAEFSALLIQPVGLAGSWKGAVSVKEHQFPHPSPRHHSWEVRLEEAWSYKRRGGAGGRGMFLHSSLCRGGERWGGIFLSIHSPALQSSRYPMLCWQEGNYRDGTVLQKAWNTFCTAPTPIFICATLEENRTDWAGSVCSWGSSFPWGVAPEK